MTSWERVILSRLRQNTVSAPAPNSLREMLEHRASYQRLEADVVQKCVCIWSAQIQGARSPWRLNFFFYGDA
jgi:hypothetical protein